MRPAILPPRRAAGFTLLEVLVALIVLSIGLLGLAALQARTVQFNSSAYSRSQATSLAYDMADRMRTNRQAALAGAYDSDFADPAPACGGAGGADIVAQDVAGWRSALACALPGGNGRIAVIGGGLVTIGVRWDDSRGAQTDGFEELFEMTTGL